MTTSPIEMPGRTVPVLSLPEAPLPDALPDAVPSRLARFMAAYAVAEHVTALSAVEPMTVIVSMHEDWGYVPGSFEWRIGPQLSMASVEEVRRFAAALGVAVVEESFDGQCSLWVADGVLNEVPFRASVCAAGSVSAVAA